jgi:2'-5' RNA ligase
LGPDPKPATRRLFVALWPSVGAQNALAAAALCYVDGERARAMPAHNLHVTLAFLGSVEEARLAELEALATALADSGVTPRAPTTLSFDRLEYWARPEILVATGPGDATASRWANDLKQALVRANFSPDLEPFRQHVTVARKVRRREDVQLAAPVQWICEGFSLVESRTGSEGASYSVVKSWTLFERDARENRS